MSVVKRLLLPGEDAVVKRKWGRITQQAAHHKNWKSLPMRFEWVKNRKGERQALLTPRPDDVITIDYRDAMHLGELGLQGR